LHVDYQVQPIAAFATKGAASAHALSILVCEAISRLERAGAEVLSLVCDGATTNKQFWKELGISGSNENIVNKVPYL